MTRDSGPRGQLDLVFSRRGDRTTLSRRVYEWPYALTRTFSLDRVPAHLLTLIVQTSAGAVHSGDRLLQRIHVEPGAAAHVTTQGATPVHRANGQRSAHEAATLVVEKDAFLEYLPQPRILFAGSSTIQTVDVACDRDARAIVSDAFTVHDPRAEGRGPGRVNSTLTLRRDGRIAMVDRFDAPNLDRWVASGRSSFGTILMAASLERDELSRLAARISGGLSAVPGLYGAASRLPDDAGIWVRLVGRDLRGVRTGLRLAHGAFREELYGAPPSDRLDAIRVGS